MAKKKTNVFLPDATEKEYLKLLVSRMELASKFGQMHEGARDIYFSCGWPQEITFWDYYYRYKRHGIARRIINAPVSSVWRGKPEITENDTPDQETLFEQELQRLIDEMGLYSYCSRVDKMAGIGEYAVLFLGISGDANLQEEVKKSKSNKLLYLSAYHQGNCDIKEYEEDAKNPRFGLPKIYEIDFARGSQGNVNRGPITLGKRRVHYSRVIHVADDVLEGEVFGQPRLQPIWNYLLSLEMVTGGSAEMYWQGALPGMAFKAQPDAEFVAEDKNEMIQQIEDYFHRLSRFLRLRGIDVEQLSPQISDPTAFIDIQITQIAATTGIPKRILTGSERGELASTQDQDNWNNRIDERRREFAEPNILRPLIDHLIDIQVLPAPKNGYAIEWPDINALDQGQQTDIDSKRTEIAAKYAGTAGLDVMIPPEIFLKDFMHFDENTIEECLKSIDSVPREDESEEPGKKPEEEKLEEVVTNVREILKQKRLYNAVGLPEKVDESE